MSAREVAPSPARAGPGVRRGLAVGLAVLALAWSVAALPEVRGTEDPRPNVIVIVTDDQSDDSIPNPYEVMPFLQRRALDPRDHWIVFENGYVNTPLCCPSRATMLTGRFSHHTGVRDNEDAHLFDDSSTLATWLHDAGYHTGLVGKYLNLYPFDRPAFVPAGWDRWWGREHGPVTSLYYDYAMFEQDHVVRYGHTRRRLRDRRPRRSGDRVRPRGTVRSTLLPLVRPDGATPPLGRGAPGRGGVLGARGAHAAVRGGARRLRQAGLGSRSRPDGRRAAIGAA